MIFQRSHFNVFLMTLTFYLIFLSHLHVFYPTALNGCWGIVFTHGVRMVRRAGVQAGGRAGGRVFGRAGGRREIVCPGCISETVRCRKLILGRDIG